jgi:prepilin-type processing-associated H-X9-DG protein
MPAKLNPYTNTKTGFYYIWGVPDGPNSMIYVFSWNRSESVFKQCGYPSDCSSFVRNYDMIYDATTITDVEQFMRNKAAGVPQNWDDGYWYDLGFRSSGTLTEPMRNQYVSTSYAYNANWGTGDFRTRDTVPGRRVVLSDYGTVIATPGPVNPDSTELIKERHSGKRVNVLWMDGSVQSMTFRELATISGGTSGFKPDVWMP